MWFHHFSNWIAIYPKLLKTGGTGTVRGILDICFAPINPVEGLLVSGFDPNYSAVIGGSVGAVGTGNEILLRYRHGFGRVEIVEYRVQLQAARRYQYSLIHLTRLTLYPMD